MQKFVAWVEIPARNFERAVAFYNAVFNLNLKGYDFGHEKMALLPNDEGAISFAPDFNPSKDGVLVSIDTGKEMDATLHRISENHGIILTPKTKIEAENRGYFAIFLDSEGNRVGLYGDC